MFNEKRFPEDKRIIETFIETEKEYPEKGINWHLRITADKLSTPLSYIRGVLEEASERNEI